MLTREDIEAWNQTKPDKYEEVKCAMDEFVKRNAGIYPYTVMLVCNCPKCSKWRM